MGRPYMLQLLTETSMRFRKSCRCPERNDSMPPAGHFFAQCVSNLAIITYSPWVELRENLEETIDFPMISMGFSCNFSLKPIITYSSCRHESDDSCDPVMGGDAGSDQ